MAYKVVFERAALEDLQEIFDYISERSPDGAVNVLEDIRRAVELTGDAPFLGRALKRRSSRMRVSLKYRYRILYEVEDDRVRIVQIVHHRRNRP